MLRRVLWNRMAHEVSALSVTKTSNVPNNDVGHTPFLCLTQTDVTPPPAFIVAISNGASLVWYGPRLECKMFTKLTNWWQQFEIVLTKTKWQVHLHGRFRCVIREANKTAKTQNRTCKRTLKWSAKTNQNYRKKLLEWFALYEPML